MASHCQPDKENCSNGDDLTLAGGILSNICSMLWTQATGPGLGMNLPGYLPWPNRSPFPPFGSATTVWLSHHSATFGALCARQQRVAYRNMPQSLDKFCGAVPPLGRRRRGQMLPGMSGSWVLALSLQWGAPELLLHVARHVW
jgi:hypothetical protein